MNCPEADKPHVVRLGKHQIALDEIPVAISNRIDREERQRLEALHPGIPMLLRNTVLIANVTYRAVLRNRPGKPIFHTWGAVAIQKPWQRSRGRRPESGPHA